MIINNKSFQNDFNIDIDNYKKLSSKYMIGERNWLGKEYLSNKEILIFEGKIYKW